MYRHQTSTSVAPHAGAWIEILVWIYDLIAPIVAPHAGAWIEITNNTYLTVITASHLTQVRGLKFVQCLIKIIFNRRTSRRCVDWNYGGLIGSNIYFSRTSRRCVDWNVNTGSKYISIKKSHLTQVRGLKFAKNLNINIIRYVAPHAGAWIEIIKKLENELKNIVAPHAGAWIEIKIEVLKKAIIMLSHLTQVRGLKCVWWFRLCWIIKSHLTQVRGLRN